MVSVVSQIGAERNEVAMALRDAGEVEEARKAYSSNALYLEQNAGKWNAPGLQKDAVANDEASRNLSEVEWALERKKQKEVQFKAQSQRSYSQKEDD